MSVKRKPTKRNPAKRAARRERSAGEVTVKLGDWFPGLPSDLAQAANTMAFAMAGVEDPKRLNCDELRAFVRGIYASAWTYLINAAVNSQGRPQLPDGVTLTHLLPSLAEGRRVMAEGKIRFEDWLERHPWPGGMRPKNTTARNWLARYSKQIDAYEKLTANVRFYF